MSRLILSNLKDQILDNETTVIENIKSLGEHLDIKVHPTIWKTTLDLDNLEKVHIMQAMVVARPQDSCKDNQISPVSSMLQNIAQIWKSINVYNNKLSLQMFTEMKKALEKVKS